MGFEFWGGLAAKSLQPMVERLLGITRDASAKPTQQLAAVRIIIGFERQQFALAKEELSVRRQTDPDARARPIDSVVNPAIVEYLFNFLTSLIQRPDVSDRIAISAGNLIHSLQRLVLAEQRWYRLQTIPRPSRKQKSSRAHDVAEQGFEPPSNVGPPRDKRAHRPNDTVTPVTVNNADQHTTRADRMVDIPNWPMGQASMFEPAHSRNGFTMPSESAEVVSSWSGM